MDRNEVKEKVVQEILKLSKSTKKEIPDDANLELDLGIDSIEKVELASNLLDIFEIEDAPVEEVVDVVSVGQVIDFIMKLQS